MMSTTSSLGRITPETGIFPSPKKSLLFEIHGVSQQETGNNHKILPMAAN
jgi:hypothetical protein